MDGPPPQSGWVLRIGRGAMLGLVRCVGEAIEGEGGEGFFQNMTKSRLYAIRGDVGTGLARRGEAGRDRDGDGDGVGTGYGLAALLKCRVEVACGWKRVWCQTRDPCRVKRAVENEKER
jgi:hypothetical protein